MLRTICKELAEVITDFFHIFCRSLLYLFFSMFLVCSPPCMVHHFVEIMSHRFFRCFVACLQVFSSDSTVVTCFTFLMLPMAVCNSSCVNSGISFHVIVTASLSVFILVSVGVAHRLRGDLQQKACCRSKSPKTLAIPFLDVIVSPFLSFFTFGRSVSSLPDLMHDKLLMPLNSSRIRCISSCFLFFFCP